MAATLTTFRFGGEGLGEDVGPEVGEGEIVGLDVGEALESGFRAALVGDSVAFSVFAGSCAA